MNSDTPHHEDVMNSRLAQVSVDTLVDRLSEHLNTQSDLCLELEEIADCLPHNINRQACLKVARRLNPVLQSAHCFEEDVLFPYLLASHGDDKSLITTVERLRYENWEDESYACELREAMRELVADRNPQTAETLGYMLRGFFTGLRRHIAFEREYFLPFMVKRQKSH